jgi:hypothetical protein
VTGYSEAHSLSLYHRGRREDVPLHWTPTDLLCDQFPMATCKEAPALVDSHDEHQKQYLPETNINNVACC